MPLAGFPFVFAPTCAIGSTYIALFSRPSVRPCAALHLTPRFPRILIEWLGTCFSMENLATACRYMDGIFQGVEQRGESEGFQTHVRAAL